MAHYEVEIKSLLGDKKNADLLQEKMREVDPKTRLTSKNTQLNHYFDGGDVKKLIESARSLFDETQQNKLTQMKEKGAHFSVRTRQRDEEVLLVLKASIDEGTSSNTVSRLEFEEPVSLTLDALDALVLEAGFHYQAKWSRVREEYLCKDFNVCLDLNAGYGYLAEFERIVEDESDVPRVREEIVAFMESLGFAQLPQERLERMFSFYNAHWPEYYGTDNVFVIE